MMRIVLFLATNLAVTLVIGIIFYLLGLGSVTSQYGLNLPALLVSSIVIGFTGSIISLLMSKTMAKASVGAHVIDQPQSADEQWLVDTVRALSQKAGIGMPEVAIYEGAPNAFATGATKNSSLVAVSTGLLQSMTREEVEAVLAHEVAHIANGDMVTLTLIQGVVNTFVVFLSRVVGSIVDRSTSRDGQSSGAGYYLTSMICQLLFGVLASLIVAWFSRRREFRADAGAARYMGQPSSMIKALARLGGVDAGALPKSVAAAGIGMPAGMSSLFASHPPIEERIAALKNANYQSGQ